MTVRLEKAVLSNTVTGERTSVMFNPEEYTVSRDSTFASATIPGLSAPLLQFISGGLQSLTMELFLDTFEAHQLDTRQINTAGQDVREFTGRITRLMDIEPTTHAPPVVLFTWSSLSFTCVLSRVAARFVMFSPDGTPVRARLSVTFTEFRNADLEPKEVKRETADYSKLHTVTDGESLSSIAFSEYGDPTAWRPIALVNDIDDPRQLTTGHALLVPALPFRDPSSGAVTGP